MSIDLIVYSQDPRPVDCAELAQALRKIGWEISLAREFLNWGKYEPSSTGELSDGDLICGWRQDHPEAKLIVEALNKKRKRSLEKFAREDAMGCLTLWVTAPPDPPEDDEAWVMRSELGDAVVQACLSAKVSYHTRTSARRNSTSSWLQDDVIKALWELRGGVWVNPRLGEYKKSEQVKG